MTAASSLRYRPSGYLSAARILAELLEPVEAETPYGGRTVSFEPLGVAWLKPGPRRRSERDSGEGVAVRETRAAEARADARLSEGRLLRWDGENWRIVQAETVGGLALLSLERTR